MKRSPEAHRLATRKTRAERAYRRALYRMPLRWITGVSPEDIDPDTLLPGRLMYMPEPVLPAYRRTRGA